MRDFGRSFEGPIIIEKVDSLPSHKPDDKSRLIFTEDTEDLYLGKSSEWQKLQGETLHGGFLFTQVIPSLIWNIEHNLGEKYVSVEVYDNDDEIISPDLIIANDENNLTISFSEEISGYARIVLGTGTSGTSGSSGTSGTSGSSGSSGSSGQQGISGTSGTSGSSGTSGEQGISGTSGSSGSSGIDGSSGTSGEQGIDGSSGTSGTSGTSGEQGISGSSGTSGTSGEQGIDGISGTSGSSGTSGTSGSSGSSGTSGESGTSGTSGEGFAWRGEWSLDEDYYINDICEKGNITYLCIENNYSSSENSPNEGIDWQDYWEIFVSGSSDTTMIKARAYRNATQNIDGDKVWTKINFDTINFDTENVIDLVNNRIIPTIPGYYQVNGQIYVADVPTNVTVRSAIWRSGTLIAYGSNAIPGATTGMCITVSDIIYCNGTTDYLELYVHSTHSTTLALAVGSMRANYFSLVGPFTGVSTSGTSGSSGSSGTSGSSGISGTSGTSGTSSAYLHEQELAGTSWDIEHNLNNKYVTVEVYNNSDEIIFPEKIKAIDSNNISISFPFNVGGKALISGASSSSGTSGKGTTDWIDIRDYASISEALLDIGSTPSVLYIPNNIILSDDIIIPNHVELKIQHPGFITLGDYDLTINGSLDVGLRQIFECNGSGKVSFGEGSIDFVRPEWWGANIVPGTTDMHKAIQSAVDTGKNVLLCTNIYAVSSTITVNTPGQRIIGTGCVGIISELAYPNQFTLIQALTADMTVVELALGRGVAVEHLCVDGANLAAYGIKMNYAKQRISHCLVARCNTANVNMARFSQLIEHSFILNSNGDGVIISPDSAGTNNDLRIFKTHISSNAHNGITADVSLSYVWGLWITQCTMENNCIGGSDLITFAHVKIPDGCKMIVLSDNYHESDIDQSGYASQLIYDIGAGVSGIIITNNYMAPSDAQKFTHQIRLGASARGITINGNYFYNIDVSAIKNNLGASGDAYLGTNYVIPNDELKIIDTANGEISLTSSMGIYGGFGKLVLIKKIIDLSVQNTRYIIFAPGDETYFIPVTTTARMDEDIPATNGNYWGIGTHDTNRRIDFGVCPTPAASSKHSKNARLYWVTDSVSARQKVKYGEAVQFISVTSTDDSAALGGNIGGTAGNQATVIVTGYIINNLRPV